MAESAIFTVMCMVEDGAGRVLAQDRKNPDWPGVTFPGGHVERGESFVAAAIREVKEETGLDIENPTLCGVKQFQTREDARYVVLFFKTDRFSGTLCSSDEGEVFWVEREKLLDYPLSHEFDRMLEVFLSEELSEFYYRRTPDGWECQLL